MDPKVHAVANALLGKNFILYSQNAILNVPSTNHYQFSWHRDLNYQHWTSSRCLALSALLCVDSFDDVTGGTYVLLATHKVEKFPSDRYVLENQLCVHARAGDWILFDSMLFHRTGKNASTAIRRAVNHIIVPPFMAQQYDFMAMLGDKLKTQEERCSSVRDERRPPRPPSGGKSVWTGYDEHVSRQRRVRIPTRRSPQVDCLAEKTRVWRVVQRFGWRESAVVLAAWWTSACATHRDGWPGGAGSSPDTNDDDECRRSARDGQQCKC